MAFLFFEAKSKSLSDLKLAYLFRNLEIVETKKNWILLVLGARVLVIKFIEFRSTFQHYIQFLIELSI